MIKNSGGLIHVNVCAAKNAQKREFAALIFKMIPPIRVFLRSGKEIPVLRFHPWVFSGAIARTEGQPEDGDLASVHDKSGQLLGIGHFHHGSIAVRLISFGPANLDEVDFWADKLRTAYDARLVALPQISDALSGGAPPALRLVHGEGDG